MDQQDDHKSIKQCIKVAGFDTDELHRIAVVGLNDAEAVSIAALKAIAVEFQKGGLFFHRGCWRRHERLFPDAHRLQGI